MNEKTLREVAYVLQSLLDDHINVARIADSTEDPDAVREACDDLNRFFADCSQDDGPDVEWLRRLIEDGRGRT
jgi:hypothetical protein